MIYKIGDSVRLVRLRGHVKKGDAGRVVTVRALSEQRQEVRVDDGDPFNPDLQSNGFQISAWLPVAAVTPAFRVTP